MKLDEDRGFQELGFEGRNKKRRLLQEIGTGKR